MSNFDCNGDDISSTWVLVHFLGCDPGKQFEILPRTRLSVPEHTVLRPKLKVKVFYGKAKLEAHVVQESDNYHELRANFHTLTEAYTENRLCEWGGKRTWASAGSADPLALEEPGVTANTAAKDEYRVLEEKYNVLKINFDALSSMQYVMRSKIEMLMERVEELTENGKSDASVKPQSGKRREHRCRVNNKSEEPGFEIEEEDGIVYFGEHRTAVEKETFDSINWNRSSAATRALLVAVFGREVLATHNLSGKQSPAFLNAGKQAKQQLDPHKTADIVQIVTRRCHVNASVVRGTITTKCADEHKMCKKRKRTCSEGTDN